MERRPLTTEDLMLIGRANVIHTYIELAKAIPGTHIERFDSFTACQSPLDLSFCNFAIDLALPEQPKEARNAVEQIARIAADRNHYRVFRLSGDEPFNASEHLRQVGFVLHHRLAQLSSTVIVGPTVLNLEHAVDPIQRRLASEFMASQFFWKQDATLRRYVVTASSGSPHELVLAKSEGRVLAAVMLTRSPGALGLYNLCVAPELRRKGIGGAIVRYVQHVANKEGVPVTLQCDVNLESWYQRLGFKKTGFVEAFMLGSERTFDIM